jgi:energy-coupling factor transport system permease protein
MAERIASRTSGVAFLRGLHPVTKLFVTVLICVAAFLFRSWIVPAALAAFLVSLHAPRSVGFRRLGAVLKPMPLFVAIIVLANVFLAHRGGSPWENAAAGLVQSMRVIVSVVAANLFLAVTEPVDLADAALRSLAPLKRLGLRVGELSLMTMITFSFIPLMMDEARRLHLALAVRCGFPKGALGMVRGGVLLVVPLVIGLFRRAEEIDLALQARCYRLDEPRSSLGSQGPRAVDYAVSAGFILAFGIGLYAHV